MQIATDSIRFKFIAAIVTVLLAGTAVLSLIVSINEGVDQQEQLARKGKGLAQYVAKLCLDPLIMKDTIRLDSIVNEARYDDDILYVLIVDKDGAIVTSQFASINYSSPRIAPFRSKLHEFPEIEQILSFIRDNAASLVVTSPVITGQESIGQVVVCLSKQGIFSNILHTVSFIILLNVLVAVLLAVLLFAVSRRIIFDPITSLGQAARQLARGNLAIRLSGSAVGEMRQLFDSFNQMADDLQQTTVSKNYFNNIITNMTESLFVISPDFVIKDVNAAAYQLLGFAQGQLIGCRADQIFDASFLQQLPAEFAQRGGYQGETWCRSNNGETVAIYFSSSVMYDDAGSIQAIVCTALDISAIKDVSEQLVATNKALQMEIAQRTQAQEEANWLNADLERQKTALEGANRELEAFCYSVSHDLRAPLRHINGFTTILREEYRAVLDAMGQDCLDRICAASSHMGALIDDLLRFSRISRAEMRVVTVDLSECARKISAMFRESDPERTTRIEIAEGLTARGDASLLNMVMQNLIGNAWKYSAQNPNAVITIGSRCEQGEEVFFVQDTGVGFDMAYKDKLFRVFERLHGEEFEGTGIGLATVQRIIERHGGRIWAEGEVGQGATFSFTLAETC
jgi:PAS domain S-box-containing protein